MRHKFYFMFVHVIILIRYEENVDYNFEGTFTNETIFVYKGLCRSIIEFLSFEPSKTNTSMVVNNRINSMVQINSNNS